MIIIFYIEVARIVHGWSGRQTFSAFYEPRHHLKMNESFVISFKSLSYMSVMAVDT